ncbi:M48 family metalloprotease [Haliea sp. E17]|uniref:M48 family metalloprotease n=1 Tax=Haliea sp. E17 TaxID=3401576 RepID=UPI003AAD8A37
MTVRLLYLVAFALALLAHPASAESVGEKQYREFKEAGALYDDVELQAYVTRIGESLLAVSGEKGEKFTFSVLDSPMINAFAAPGGYIYVSRGLLPYLESEEELAGVLGHEIAHVDANHHGRRKGASVASKVASITTYILTGSGELAQASDMYGAELISGYGRDMELEADGLGAEYMYRAGYDPQALLQVISVLKDQEQYTRLQARSAGKPAGTYHGLYASHPRNDKRLQTVIAKARELDVGDYVESPEQPGEFRSHIEGLVWGESVQGEREENRYYHNKLAFSFAHPEGWTVSTSGRAVIAQAPDGSASLTITLARRDNDTPEQALRGSVVGDLSAGTALEQGGLQGYTALASSGGASKRLAVIDYNYRYRFEGAATDMTSGDAALKQIIESFRPLQPKEKQAAEPHYVHYYQVPRGATFASIAAGIKVPDAENKLRLLNGMYPRGEPRTGDWIKVIR